MISRLVNQFIKSTKTLYLPENEPKGLIVCLNPKLSRFLKSPQELNVYRKGPWNLLLPSDSSSLTVEWNTSVNPLKSTQWKKLFANLTEDKETLG